MFDTKPFKTKTEMNERENRTVEGTWTIAADIGYSGVKIMSPAYVACFPSFASRLAEDRGIIGEVDENYILYTDMKTGEKWLVGQYAQNSISDRDTSVSEEALFGRERYEDPMYRVIISTALGIGMLPGKTSGPTGKVLHIQTGYPPAYEDDKDEMQDAFAGEHFFRLQIGTQNPIEFRFFVDRNRVHVMAQPMGTLFSVTVDNNGQPVPEKKDCLRKAVVVFDAGFGTLDLFPIKNGRLEKSQTNQNLGMKRVMQDTCTALNDSGVNIEVPALQKYLETGFARYNTRKTSRNVPFGDILRESSKKICAEAISWMTQTLWLPEYDYLIITGGTADAWKDMIREELKEMETLEIIDGNCNDNLPYIFANVRGYYLYRIAKLQAAKKAAAAK